MLKELKGFDEYVLKSLKALKVQGTAIAVIKNGEVVHCQGYGLRDVKNNLPVDPDTIFAIGSSSKAFTTLAMGILVDRGKLEWDKPVRTYLPTFKLYDPFATERMTPRDLVCHRSGLPRHDLMWYGTTKTRKEIFDRLAYLEPNKDFRTYLQYQNLMFMTAGYLIEVVDGRTWEQFVKEEIFNKLGMTRSNTSVDDTQKMENFSKPYREKKNKVEEIPFRNIDTIGPAGSINSSLNDVVKWAQLHLNDGKIGEQQIISATNIHECHVPNMTITGQFFGAIEKYPELSSPGAYGLGWFINQYQGKTLIHHGGNIDGFSAMVSFMPSEKAGVVVLTNMNGSSMVFTTMLNAYDRLLGVKPAPWLKRAQESIKEGKAALKAGKTKASEKKVRGTRPSHKLAAYVGQFEHPGYGILTVTLEEKGLAAEYNGIKFPLKHYHYDIFEMHSDLMEVSLKVSFFTDTAGNISSVSAPLEPSVKDIVFTRIAEKSMTEKSFLEQFVGEYEVMGQTLSISLRGENTLFAAMPGQPEIELAPYQGTTFNVKNIPALTLEFKIVDGKVTGVDVNQMGMVLEAKKR